MFGVLEFYITEALFILSDFFGKFFREVYRIFTNPFGRKKPFPVTVNKIRSFKIAKYLESTLNLDKTLFVENLRYSDCYKLIEYDSIYHKDGFSDVECSEIRINKKLYKALLFCDESRISYNRMDLDFEKIIQEIIKEDDEFQQWWKNGEEDYCSLRNYQRNLINSGGDGYTGIFDGEFKELKEKYNNEFMSFMFKFTENLHQKYFSYSQSTVEDLSVIDGVRSFWFSKNSSMVGRMASNISAYFGRNPQKFKASDKLFYNDFEIIAVDLFGEKFWNDNESESKLIVGGLNVKVS